MLTAPDSQGTTGERSHNQINQDPFNTEFTKTLTKSSPHFGALSHHSFFSQHNPHPQRATHIQGLNGRPICMVRDDWCVTSSLFPHPLLKSHVLRKSPGPALTFPLTQNLHAVSGNNNKSALFSEAWRDELKELVAKVNLSFRAQLGKMRTNLRMNLCAKRLSIQLILGESSLHPASLTCTDLIPST
uniref:Uncharacterized protein n=1 Tax=Amphiprion ocellaris TaxID=80972 RepID=A0AAQ6AM75_AMPOC